MKKFLPIFISIITIITITIITIYSNKYKKPWAEMSKEEKRIIVYLLSAGLIFLFGGVIAFIYFL